jgi:hypothetical protein
LTASVPHILLIVDEEQQVDVVERARAALLNAIDAAAAARRQHAADAERLAELHVALERAYQRAWPPHQLDGT